MADGLLSLLSVVNYAPYVMGITGIWNPARGARASNRGGLQQHFRQAHCGGIPGTGLQSSPAGNLRSCGSEGAAAWSGACHLQRSVHLPGYCAACEQVCCQCSVLLRCLSSLLA